MTPSAGASPEAGQGPRILVVEDDDAVRFALAMLLADAGWQVDEANNGRAALDRLTADDVLPNVILLDLMMPVLDGRGFLAERRATPRLRAVPVIVCTANGSRSGVDPDEIAGWLAKPFDIPSLWDVLARASS